MIKYKISEDRKYLTINTFIKIKHEHPISEVIEFNNILIVRLFESEDKYTATPNRNVLAYNERGKHLWTIEEVSSDNQFKPWTEIFIGNKEEMKKYDIEIEGEKLLAKNWCEKIHQVDINTGKVRVVEKDFYENLFDVKNINCKLEDNNKSIKIEDKKYMFDVSIYKVLEFNNILFVLLLSKDENDEDTPERNIFAYDKDGNHLWTIEESPKLNPTGDPYGNIFIADEDYMRKNYAYKIIGRKLIAYNWHGYFYEVDIKTGKIKLVEGQTRAW